MKRLFIGCRVRILYSTTWPELAGQEGRIVGLSPSEGVSGQSEWLVAPDCWGTPVAPKAKIVMYKNIPHRGTRFAPNSDQLEPILPEGHKPAEMGTEELLPNIHEWAKGKHKALVKV